MPLKDCRRHPAVKVHGAETAVDITNFFDIREMNFMDTISLKGISDYICYNRGQGYKVECTIGATIKVNPPSNNMYNHA